MGGATSSAIDGTLATASGETRYPNVDPAHVRRLLEGGVENLIATWNEELALFPFSSRLRGSEIVNDYTNPTAVRYTINSLLGLLRNARSGAGLVTEPDVRALVESYFQRDHGREALAADRGLETLLLAELGADSGTVAARLRMAADALGRGTAHLNMQDVAWILWGAAAAARADVPAARDVARRAFELIRTELVDAGTGLPRHTSQRYRRNVVSFGSLTYFLRAMHEAADALGEQRARDLFDSGVTRAIALQGPLGEWPWMINCATGEAFDFYPVFAVHQDSMAMLFLHPAANRELPGAADAVAPSLAWVFGANELECPMFVERPFFAYRSIERAERVPRLRRYARSVRTARPATTAADRIRINDECRSYHLGWVLYAWSDWSAAAPAAG